MPKIPTITNHAFVIKSEDMVENAKFKNSESSIQVAST
jgi:hypothetical protein